MQTLRSFKQFISSQYLSYGVRITTGVLLPSLIFYQLGQMASGMAISIGALCVSLTDTPGPVHHRRNAMLYAIGLNSVVAIIIGLCRPYPLVLAGMIGLMGWFLSMFSIYGSRAGAVGALALIIMVLSIDDRIPMEAIYQHALLLMAGGAWYMLLSLLLYRIKPYAAAQQALGECIIETARYMQDKAAFYSEHPAYEQAYRNLMQEQVRIHQLQDQVREILFRTRSFIRDTTPKGRSLLLIFQELVDLFEHIMTSQQNYPKLHRHFDHTGILNDMQAIIYALAEELEEIGTGLQMNRHTFPNRHIGHLLQETEQKFQNLRAMALQPESLDGYISLRHIIYNLKEIHQRIMRLHRLERFPEGLKLPPDLTEDYHQFVGRTDFTFEKLKDNCTLASNQFRHALRIVVGLLLSLGVAHLFQPGHAYWILLTVLTILKPAFSISKQRNIHRISGTVAGCVLGGLALYFITNGIVLFILMVAAMIVSYSLLQKNYFVSVIGITIYVLLAFHFLHPSDFTQLAGDRILDTLIGSVIAFLVSRFVLPNWESEQIETYMQDSLLALRDYFDKAAAGFTGPMPHITTLKLARKQVFVTLANLSDAFQRMLNEPYNKQPEALHAFVVLQHSLGSHIASLSVYERAYSEQLRNDEFTPLVEQVSRELGNAYNIMTGTGLPLADTSMTTLQSQPMMQQLAQLMQQRADELNAGDINNPSRHSISKLKVVLDQFELIYALSKDTTHLISRYRQKVAPIKNSTPETALS
jgi:uncharacterized membrane protein YccC